VLVLAYFFITDTGLDEYWLSSWVPVSYQARVQVVLVRLRQRLTRWVWAQVAIAVYFALTFSTGLALLKVHFAFTIGLIGGMLEIVPYLGGAIAVLLAILSALTVDPLKALWVVILYLIVTEVESHILAPAFFGRVMGLHPAIILIALLVGAKLKGIVGVFFAVPTAVVLTAVLQEMRTSVVSPELDSTASNEREKR
jgi:predicted PurR-regulated permease PerM